MASCALFARHRCLARESLAGLDDQCLTWRSDGERAKAGRDDVRCDDPSGKSDWVVIQVRAGKGAIVAEMQTPLLIKRARGDCGVSQMCRALEVQKGKMGSSAGGRVGHAKHVI